MNRFFIEYPCLNEECLYSYLIEKGRVFIKMESEESAKKLASKFPRYCRVKAKKDLVAINIYGKKSKNRPYNFKNYEIHLKRQHKILEIAKTI